ncbi:PAC2 family protein [Corynebacterium pseudotuberculosis]|uniref:PAC2 family protein n=1 Tax=Corynebacterium pseudotuberculosis TaxID=1719 RepID=UPI0009914A0D|nr:PAC2 family protein [Corynebacterium pseudotuberculosis]AQU92947.1 Proteasome assembly chaperones 2 (PAC2) [Corynebacterium pseudotuberculosis]
MQEKNARMYELEFPAPEVSLKDSEGPTLIVALQGYADAGHAIDASAEHLLAALEHRPVASFNNDELIDYRSRRPSVTIEHNNIVSAEELALGIEVLRDNSGTPFLLLSGPEPDLRWDAFTKAVADLVERFGVSRTICLYAAPMAAPHTRPMVVSAHGNSTDLIDHHFSLDTRITVPGSASLQLERLLNKQGRNVAGYTAHVPHYLSASPYPQATLSLLEAVSSSTGLKFPLRTLEEDSRKVAMQVEEQVANSAEIENVVRLLEQQYDGELERYREAHPEAVMPGDGVVPNAELLGEEFEKFLADIDNRSLNGGKSEKEKEEPPHGDTADPSDEEKDL